MKRLLGTLFLLAAFSLPMLAGQQWRLSSNDQARFDSYFSRWQDYRQANDRDQIVSMERRMQSVYAQYGVPDSTPYWRVASNGRDERRQWRNRLSEGDQARFDSYFSRWEDYRQSNNREQIFSMEKRMQGVYAQYNIPANTPFEWVATERREERRHDEGRRDERRRDRWQDRLSSNDQARFDDYYQRWLGYRRDNNRHEVESMERRMRGVMDQYRIPPDVPFEQIASRSVSH